MSVVWNDSEIALLEALRSVCNTREIQNVFADLNYKRSMEAISKKGRQVGISFLDFGIPKMAGLSDSEREAVQQMLNKRESLMAVMQPTLDVTASRKAAINSKLKELSIKVMDSLVELRDEVPRTCSVSNKKAEGGEGKISLVLYMSDNHVGRKVFDEEGVEIYNMAEAVKRIENTPSKILEKLSTEELERVDEIVVCLIGDHIDGEGVFFGQEMMLEDHIAEQVKTSCKAFWNMLTELKTVFPLVRVVTTRGNHGRGGVSPESNWDTMLFQQLELLIDMQGDPNLVIKNRYGEFNNFEVKGWKGHVRHKAPQQASTAAGASRYAGWHGIHQWDFFGFGHFHNASWFSWLGKPIFKNGSMMGADDYSESLAVRDEAMQLLIGITEEDMRYFIKPLVYEEYPGK